MKVDLSFRLWIINTKELKHLQIFYLLFPFNCNQFEYIGEANQVLQFMHLKRPSWVPLTAINPEFKGCSLLFLKVRAR